MMQTSSASQPHLLMNQTIPPVSAMQIRNQQAVGVVFHTVWGHDNASPQPLSLFEVTGKDAAQFLQNRTSNNVQALKVGEGHLNTVLDKNGKIQGVFSLHRLATQSELMDAPSDTSPTFLLVTDTQTAQHTINELLRFKILEDISITPTERVGLSFHGASYHQFINNLIPISKAQLALMHPHSVWQANDSSGAHLKNAPILIQNQPCQSLGEPAISLWFSPDQIEEVNQQLLDIFNKSSQPEQDPHPAFGCLSSKEWDTLRIEVGQLLPETDYTTTTLLPETGLEQSTVDYAKGCYLGQETVARVRTYGAVPKAMMGLTSSSPIPLGDLYLASDSSDKQNTKEKQDKPIGTVTSSIFSESLNQHIALAYLNKTHREPAQNIQIQAEDKQASPTQVTVCQLPFIQNKGNKTPNEHALKAFEKGLADFANGDDQQAINQLTRAILLNPALADAYESLGAILGRNEEYDDAIALMHHLETLDPDRIMAQTNLSVYYMKIGDKETAEVHKAKATTLTFKAAMAKNMTSEQATKSSDELAKEKAAAEEAAQKQLLERAQMFREALQYSPEDPLGNFGLGSTLLELNDFTGAIEALEKTVHLPTSQSAAYEKLGQAYEGAHHLEQAIATYQAGVETASRRRDLIPLKAMQTRLDALLGSA